MGAGSGPDSFGKKTMNTVNFRAELRSQLAHAEERGAHHVDINSGKLHRQVGGYPGNQHRMPVCCDVLRAEMENADQVLKSPPKGKGASLTIRYFLPRKGR